MFTIFIVHMANKFEIGQKVFWEINQFVVRALFLREIDSEFSEVKCYERNGRRCIHTLKVITALLNFDGDN